MQIGVETSRAVENKRIFVVDDDEIIRAAIQFMLHDENETHEVASLDAAFEKAKDWRPDLIILSESVVRANGVDVVERIKGTIPEVKVLVIVENVADGFGKVCVAAGANSFIAKPLRIEFVRQKVDVLMGRRKSLEMPLKVLNT